MAYIIAKLVFSVVMVIAAGMMARRSPGIASLVIWLLFAAMLGVIWVWPDQPDPVELTWRAKATFNTMLPFFPLIPVIVLILRQGGSILSALVFSLFVAIALWVVMIWAGPRLGLPL